LRGHALSNGNAVRRTHTVDGIEFGLVFVEDALTPRGTVILRRGCDRVEFAVTADRYALT
jgi:hypothetical protein